MITDFQEYNMQKMIAQITALVTILSLSILPCVFAGTYTIRQELFTWTMEMAQAVPDDTFIITRLLKKQDPQGVQKKQKDQNFEHSVAGEKAANSDLAVAHFQLGSSVLTPAEKESILRAVSKGKINMHTPLVITGYTCRLGADSHNQRLSRQRAEAVARVLRTNGFQVATVRGKGSLDPITNDPSQLYRNRRVEISINRHGRNGQSGHGRNNDTAPLL